MSLTPPDERGGPESRDGDDQSTDRSLLSRTLGRVAGACRAVGRAVRAGTVAVLDAPSRPAIDQSERPAEVDPERDADEATTSLQLGPPSRDGESDDDDAASPPPVVSARDAAETAIVADEFGGPDTERPALEVQWHGDAVTFVSPEEPDARITSDVWEDLER